tara:strand:- start:77 stop:256 length:180 start_codon:yes stop_codon:yes gene_type:complete
MEPELVRITLEYHVDGTTNPFDTVDMVQAIADMNGINVVKMEILFAESQPHERREKMDG